MKKIFLITFSLISVVSAQIIKQKQVLGLSDSLATKQSVNSSFAGNVLIAASNAPQSVKNAAQYICIGSMDDTTIQRAVNEAAGIGEVINLSQGKFYIDSTITISKDGIRIIGNGYSVDSAGIATELFQENDYDVFRIKKTRVATYGLRGLLFENFMIRGATISDTSGGFRFQNTTNTTVALNPVIRNVYVWNTGYGAIIKNTDYPTLDHVMFSENRSAGEISGSSFGMINNCLFSDNTENGLNLFQGAMTVVGNSFVRNNSSTSGGWDLRVKGYVFQNTITGNTFNGSYNAVLFDSITALNSFTGNTVNATNIGVKLDRGANANTINANTFQQCGYSIYLDGSGTNSNNISFNSLLYSATKAVYCTTNPHYNNFLWNSNVVSGTWKDATDIYDISSQGNTYQPHTRLILNDAGNQSTLLGFESNTLETGAFLNFLGGNTSLRQNTSHELNFDVDNSGSPITALKIKQNGDIDINAISAGTWHGTAITVPYGGTGISSTTAYGVIAGGTTSTGAFQNIGTGTGGQALVSNGSSALPSFQTLTLPPPVYQEQNTVSSFDPQPSTLDVYALKIQDQNFTVSNPATAPVKFKPFLIRIKDDGTSRTITWDTKYRALNDIALPTATVTGTTMYLQFIYNYTDDKYDLIGYTK